MGLAAQGIGARSSLLYPLKHPPRPDGVYFISLRRRFADSLEPDLPEDFDLHVEHPDDAVAGLSLLFCLRRYCFALEADHVSVAVPELKA
jgi:hypothetical protein